MNQPGCSSSHYEIVNLPEFLPSPSPTTSTANLYSQTKDSSTLMKCTPKIIVPKKETTERQQRPTECSICGKDASGYHYDVPSCNGCKTFFRRLCISEKNFACKAKGDCFDLRKRAQPLKCRACRYQKCITAGMNPLAMEVDAMQATAANFKTLTKRVKEEEPDDYNYNKGTQDDTTGVVAPKQVKTSLDSPEIRIQKLIDMLGYLEGKLEKFRLSAYNPPFSEFRGLKFLIETSSRICLADKYGPMPGWPLKPEQLGPPPPRPPRVIGGHGPPPYRPDKKQWFAYNLMTTVEYAKTFSFFHKLSSNDKLCLVKYVALACVNLHCSYSAIAKNYDTLINPDGSQPPFGSEAHYKNMVMSVAPLIRYEVQRVEYLLLKAICLCNPAVPELSKHAQDIIAEERSKYADALFDHCLKNRRNGPAHFAHLIGIMDVLERQQRMQKDLHLLHIAPLLARASKDWLIQVIEDVMDC
ncbi:unnamed protein product [Caenorhabditis sp. 36 PRJEB53466]|nr:unnamed protein product [Caenorhabditis sp. 36 PRJEB53466]